VMADRRTRSHLSHLPQIGLDDHTGDLVPACGLMLSQQDQWIAWQFINTAVSAFAFEDRIVSG
jgi:hypothetical protein